MPAHFPPIGTEYLEFRAELSSELTELINLAAEIRANEATINTLHGLQNSLKEPFLFVVVGEVKSGKSSLLNALFGQEFCKVDVLPTTDRVHVFKHADSSYDLPISATLVERYLPIDFLNDFNIVDTPGTNTIIAEHQIITEQFVPQADLIIFVLSITNPWGGSAWDFLNLLQKKWLKNVVFVLQQTDLREEHEVNSIVDHLKQTALQRLGRDFPIFPVSAKKALLSKTTTTDKDKLWKESGFGEFENYINDFLQKSEVRREKLSSVLRTCNVILTELADGARKAALIIQTDREQLAQLHSTIAQLQKQTRQQVDGFLRNIDHALDAIENEGLELLENRLRFWATVRLIFSRDQNWQQEFQSRIETMLKTAVTKELEHALTLLEAELKHVWSQVLEKLQRNFGEEARSQLTSRSTEFFDQRKRLVEKIELTMLEQLSDDKIEKQLQMLFEETANWMRLPAGTAIAGGIAAIIATQMASIALFDVTGVLAALTAITGTFIAIGKRRKILSTYQNQMGVKKKELTKAIAQLILQTIDAFYQRLAQLYQPLETFCNVQEERHAPLLAKIQALEEKFQKTQLRIT